MKLFGFQCDNCGVKSRDKPGNWIEVTSMLVNQDSWSAHLQSDGLHYCSKDCLKTAIDTWKK